LIVCDKDEWRGASLVSISHACLPEDEERLSGFLGRVA
jgi:hypothetical protein